ncbi:Type IV secretory pathway, VirB6 component precursor [Sphingobium yanoikuyae]|uniref:Type IV secretory pathway, VirB6 component n=1 Tax=Sphingobium yanoikuyae TaxID=13690 RepID=A0A084EG08_SPHYA|nr:type IV secretion system protein [Sphingobium yanoikuyae]KEZ16900.1 Type IV secretory pathway, VirB6 component precursor [Sphingobium yanoikuyae]
MTCALTTQNQLTAALSQIDCQARTIGAYGYGALAESGSIANMAVIAALAIFLCLFAFRLLLGYPLAGRDGFNVLCKMGIVLTLATAWPAWRSIAYDLVLDGPGQISHAIGATSMSSDTSSLFARLQAVDDGLVSLTQLGSGRANSVDSPDPDQGDISQGVTMTDKSALAAARATFLATSIGSAALVRIGAGLLLALAPLIAALLLFGETVGLFVGWTRALAFVALGSLVLTLLQTVQIAMLAPWLADVLTQRQSAVYTPAAPTELFILTLSSAGMIVGVLLILACVAFARFLRILPHVRSIRTWRTALQPLALRQPILPNQPLTSGNALRPANNGRHTAERKVATPLPLNGRGSPPSNGASVSGLGESFRRLSTAHERRDGAR